MNNQYFAYTRVSTVKQGEGASLEAQKDAIERYAAQHGLPITHWFEEKETAAKQGRPVFTEMINQLRSGKGSGVIMHKIDRSARNLRDWATVNDLQDEGISVHFAAESVDFASRGGRLTADIQAVIAADYIRNLKEETLKGVKARLTQGIYPLKAPIGYLNNGGGKLKTICPEKGPLVRQLLVAYSQGSFTIRGLVKEAERIGLKGPHGGKLSQTCIEKMLANPFYTGVIHIRTWNETFVGKHGALISKATFDRIQAVKSTRTVRKIKTEEYPFRRLFSCKRCGRSYIPERQKGLVYYRCHTPQCTKGSLREEVIDEAVTLGLSTIEASTKTLEPLHRRLVKLTDDTHKSVPNLSLELHQISAKRKRLTDAMLDGILTKEQFQIEQTELNLLEADLQKQRNEPLKMGRRAKTVQKFLELAKSPLNMYFSSNPAEKRELVEMVFSNRVVDGKNVELEPNFWIGNAAKSAAVLFSTQTASFHRSDHEFENWVIRTSAELENCPEFHSMWSLYQRHIRKNSEDGLPEASSDVGYREVI